MRALYKFKNALNVQVLFVFVLISGALISIQVPVKHLFPLPFQYNRSYSNADTTGSETKKLLGYNGQKRPSVMS